VGEVVNHIAKERGVSVLLIEQNANLALKLANRGHVFETGTIALEGTSDDLLGNEHVRVAYLGS
jgi:branched-chain amino acid transport system ATP-binding protein